MYVVKQQLMDFRAKMFLSLNVQWVHRLHLPHVNQHHSVELARVIVVLKERVLNPREAHAMHEMQPGHQPHLHNVSLAVAY